MLVVFAEYPPTATGQIAAAEAETLAQAVLDVEDRLGKLEATGATVDGAPLYRSGQRQYAVLCDRAGAEFVAWMLERLG